MLLSTSSRHGKEKGQILLEYFEDIDTKSKEQKLKSEVTQLAKLRDKLRCRASLLTEEINDQTKPKVAFGQKHFLRVVTLPRLSSV